MTDGQAPILDEGVLAALGESVGGDESFVADLVQTYLGDGAEQLAAIEAAVGAEDAEALVRPAHTLKSASLTVGAMRLGEVSRGLEMRGREGRLDGAAADAATARETWAATEEALRHWLSERPRS